MNRRQFMAATLATTGASAIGGMAQETARISRRNTLARPLIVSTWPFGKPANEKALEAMEVGGSNLDGVEQGIRLVEADAGNASVGLGGIPNADGVVQLDACVMDGPGHRAGGVCALEDILHPVSVARKVMEETRHVYLAGAGAKQFALKQGFQETDLLTGGARQQWEDWKRRQSEPSEKNAGHDTIALLVLGRDGHLAGGCSTSGMGYKVPGRVGDSPIIGSGLYVDDEVGAAGATGVGENVLRYCGSFLVVEYMRQGLHPEEACLKAIERIARKDPLGVNLQINFVALDVHGQYGAAGSGSGFQYAVTFPGTSQVLRGAALGKLDVGPEGGNLPDL